VSSTNSALGKAARRARTSDRFQVPREGLTLLAGIVGLMWIVEIVNAADGYALSGDGIYSRSVSHLWGIFTAPFIHENFAPHLLDNTIPLVFLGVIIAWRGAQRLAAVTAIVIVLGGLGTWLIGPAGVSTIGASGVVFGYATYLLTRGFFDRKLWEIATAVIVGAVWGGTLLASLEPHKYVSWQGHLMGGVAGVVAAYAMASRDRRDNGKKLQPQRPAIEAGAN
jgi:membrane associated rhomboid family serine protease